MLSPSHLVRIQMLMLWKTSQSMGQAAPPTDLSSRPRLTLAAVLRFKSLLDRLLHDLFYETAFVNYCNDLAFTIYVE